MLNILLYFQVCVMLGSTVEPALTPHHHLTVCSVACVLLVDTVLLVQPPLSLVTLDTMYHPQALSLSLTVFHVSLVSSVLEVLVQPLLITAFRDITVRAELLQEVSI